MLKFQAITIIVRFQVTTIIMKSPGERACGTPYIAQANGMSNCFGYLWDLCFDRGSVCCPSPTAFFKSFEATILNQPCEERGLQGKFSNWHGLPVEWIPRFSLPKCNSGEQ